MRSVAPLLARSPFLSSVGALCALCTIGLAAGGAAAAGDGAGDTGAATTACGEGPAGTRCVAAGSVDVGAGELARKVTLERFFVDEHLVTAGDYRKCVKAKACAPVPDGAKRSAPVEVDWPRAERYCAFAGERLASEAEWQAAAGAGVLAPGERAPKGEWTNTWSVTPKQCPSANASIPAASQDSYFPEAKCGTHDVLDACDGAVLCGTLHRRVVKALASPGERSAASSLDDKAARAFRCATSVPYLTKFPSRFTTQARPRPPDPPPPTAEQLAAFDSVEEDTLDVPPCPKKGRSFLTCRDPASYLKSNEPRLGVLVPYVENMGGAYTGVASDQNYTFVALARSQWAWLFDYDANVVRWHHVLRAIILDSPDRKAFLAHFAKGAVGRGVEVLAATYHDDPGLKDLQTLWRSSASSLASHYERQSKQPYTWLGSDEHYGYIRLLYRQGRMRALRGNMLDVHAMHTIGEAAKKLAVPIHIYYPSNAAEFWPFNDHYRDNVRNLPFDDESIVVQTISGLSLKTGFGQEGYWHYNVQYGREQQKLLGLLGYTREKQLLWHRVKTDSGELTLCGMPSP